MKEALKRFSSVLCRIRSLFVFALAVFGWFYLQVYVCFILITVANMSAVEERVAEKRHLDDKDVENGVAAKEAKLENGSAVST